MIYSIFELFVIALTSCVTTLSIIRCLFENAIVKYL